MLIPSLQMDDAIPKITTPRADLNKNECGSVQR